MKLFSKIRVWKDIVRMVCKAVPLNCFLALCLSLLMMLYYTFSVKITAGLFESADVYFRLDAGNYKQVVGFAVLFIMMRLLQSIIIFLNGVNGNVFIYRKATDYFRRLLSQKAARLSPIMYEDTAVNDMFARAQSVVEKERLSDQFEAMLNIINTLFSVFGIAIVLCGYSPVFLVIALPSVFPFFIMRIVRGREFYKMKYFQAKTKRSMDYYWSLLFDKASMKEISTYAFFDYIRNKWAYYRNDVDEKTWEFRKEDSKAMLLMNMISTAGYLLSISSAVWMVWKNSISIGVLGASLSAFLSMQNYTKSFLINLGNLAEDARFAEDYLDFLKLPDAPDGTQVLECFPNTITLNHVSFQYPNGREDALKDVCLRVSKGESLVLVGENGSGKSTLIKILLGIYECKCGEVLLDGASLSQIKKESLYEKISFMMQDPQKHQTTIREAVALSDVKHMWDDQKIFKALQQAKIDYILGTAGLDTRIGKEFGGIGLSGGEWQRIALARALFKDCDMMILDEPTSAIDPISEMDILKALLEKQKGKTSIIISHRVGICTAADKVAFLKNGRVAEYGSHEELMKLHGEYYSLFTAQSQWYQ